MYRVTTTIYMSSGLGFVKMSNLPVWIDFLYIFYTCLHLPSLLYTVKRLCVVQSAHDEKEHNQTKTHNKPR